MAIFHRAFGFIITLLLIACGLSSFAVNAKEAWVDDAISFAEKLKQEHPSVIHRTVEQTTTELSKLPSLVRLEAYQRISFLYLTELRVDEYQAFKKEYSSLLSQSEDNKYLDMQLVLDVLEASLMSEKLDEAIVTIESLIESKLL